MTVSTWALLVAAVAPFLPVTALARSSTARLQITAIVVRRSVVPVRAAEPDGAAGAAEPPRTAARHAPVDGGPAPVVVFTDGAPSSFVIQVPPRSAR